MLQIFQDSIDFLKVNFSRFVAFFVIECLIQMFSPLAESRGVMPGTATHMWVGLLGGLLSIWNFTHFLHIVLEIRAGKDEGFVERIIQATYDAPAFLLYSLMYGLTMMLGALLLLIPGLYFCIFHYFAPLASVLDPEANEGKESYFAYSRRLVNPHWGKVIVFFISILILNGFVPSLSFIPALKEYRVTIDMGLTPLAVLLGLIGDVLAVNLYYFLRDFKPLDDEKSL